MSPLCDRDHVNKLSSKENICLAEMFILSIIIILSSSSTVLKLSFNEVLKEYKPAKDAFERGIVSIDEDALLNDLESTLDLEYFSSTGDYSTINMAEERYYIFPTDI